MNIQINPSIANQMPDVYFSLKFLNARTFSIRLSIPTEGIIYAAKDKCPSHAKRQLLNLIIKDIQACIEHIQGGETEITSGINPKPGLTSNRNRELYKSNECAEGLRNNHSTDFFKSVLPAYAAILRHDDMRFNLPFLIALIVRFGETRPLSDWWYTQKNFYKGKPANSYLAMVGYALDVMKDLDQA